MRKLGISIFPDRDKEENIKDYLLKASKYGFNRIFSSLLNVSEGKENVVKKYREINLFAKKLGFEIVIDVNPKIFAELGISYNDLSFFKLIEVDGIRLDEGFSGLEESIMTFNKENLKVEINMSNNTSYIDMIMDYMPNAYNLIACHNYYPHEYSGLSVEHYKECNKRFNKYALETSAFITSQNKNIFGASIITKTVPTLEIHRNLPIDVQLKHFIAMNENNNFIISNCYPTEEELINISKTDLYCVNFDISVVDGISEIEGKILFDEVHFNRGDISNNMIRSTLPRIKYKGNEFRIFNPAEIINKGDIIIESSNYGHYAGEMQIALATMKNSGMSNVVGRVKEEEIFILDYIKPWQKFRLSLK